MYFKTLLKKTYVHITITYMLFLLYLAFYQWICQVTKFSRQQTETRPKKGE